MKIQYDIPCNIAQTLNIIGDKWTLLILHQILIGKETYKDILDNLVGLPTNLLSERLKSLETDELIERTLYQDHPPRYKYTLTEKGYDLDDIFTSIILWGEKHLNKCYKKIVHKDCNHSIEHMYYCPHCDKKIKIDDLTVYEPNNL